MSASLRLARLFAASVFAVALAACASAPTPGPPAPIPIGERTDVLIVEIVDVGQGDGMIIRSPTGKAIIVDAGDRPGWKPMLAQLAADGIEVLDLAIISHPHADHIGGMEKVLERVPTKLFLDPGFDASSGIYTRLLEFLARTETRVVIARAGRTIDIGGGARIELLAPAEPLLTGTRSDANANSIVFKLVYGETSMLFTGDSEAPTEARLLREPTSLLADVLKVAHHGSEHSTQDAFLAAVRPRIAVISCGLDNKFSHPGPGTVSRLERVGARILRTDLLGTITLKSDGLEWTVVLADGRDAPEVPMVQRARPPPADERELDEPDPPYEPEPVAPEVAQRADINKATVAELVTVKGVGPSKAAAIVEYIRAHGPLRRIEDLVAVPGIGHKTMLNIAARFGVFPPQP